MLPRRSFLAAALLPALPAAERIVLQLPEATLQSSEWSGDIDAPTQPGSLWKPFLAAAYSGPNPRFHCDGKQCWLNRRHGWLDMPGALAQSCNQWFHQLYKVLPQPLNLLSLPPAPDTDWPNWRCSPRQLAFAYAELLARRADYPLVIAGLRQAAERGTAAALGPNYLAKTGTAPSQRYAGDGWVFAAHPADNPSTLILYRQQGVTGAQAAAALARSLPRAPR